MRELPMDLILREGEHPSPDAGMCVMEAVAYVAGEPHSDHPACVSPVIGEFLRVWNDGLSDDATRTRLLAPLIPVVIGTATSEADEQTRAWLATDWLVRVHAPAWLRLAGLTEHADALAGLPAITDTASATAAQPTIDRARGASAAARNAASAAASAAAWDAAWDALMKDAAASAAAWAAAWDAASAAASAAAWDAAASAAAWGAARNAVAPTVAILQESAVDLVHRMAAVGREPAPEGPATEAP